VYLVCSYDDICERTFCLQCARWLPTEIHSTHCQQWPGFCFRHLCCLLLNRLYPDIGMNVQCALHSNILPHLYTVIYRLQRFDLKNNRNEKWYFSDHTILMCWDLCLNIMSFGSDLKSFWYCLMDFGIMCHSSYHVDEMFIADCIIFYERHSQKR